MNPDIDDLYKLHYCIIGADNKVYKAISSTTDRYILLNLMNLPLDGTGKFTITIKAVLESYKGHTGIITH